MVLLLGAACSPSAPIEPRPPAVSEYAVGDEISIERLRDGGHPLTSYSGFDRSARLVIRDAAAWKAAWEQIWARVIPKPELPGIDFDQQMVVLAAMGSRPTGGHGIFIQGAHQGEAHIEVSVRSTSPGAGCMVTQAFTAPVDVILLPRSEQEVRFAEQSDVFRCQ